MSLPEIQVVAVPGGASTGSSGSPRDSGNESSESERKRRHSSIPRKILDGVDVEIFTGSMDLMTDDDLRRLTNNCTPQRLINRPSLTPASYSVTPGAVGRSSALSPNNPIDCYQSSTPLPTQDQNGGEASWRDTLNNDILEAFAILNKNKRHIEPDNAYGDSFLQLVWILGLPMPDPGCPISLPDLVQCVVAQLADSPCLTMAVSLLLTAVMKTNEDLGVVRNERDRAIGDVKRSTQAARQLASDAEERVTAVEISAEKKIKSVMEEKQTEVNRVRKEMRGAMADLEARLIDSDKETTGLRSEISSLHANLADSRAQIDRIDAERAKALAKLSSADSSNGELRDNLQRALSSIRQHELDTNGEREVKELAFVKKQLEASNKREKKLRDEKDELLCRLEKTLKKKAAKEQQAAEKGATQTTSCCGETTNNSPSTTIAAGETCTSFVAPKERMLNESAARDIIEDLRASLAHAKVSQRKMDGQEGQMSQSRIDGTSKFRGIAQNMLQKLSAPASACLSRRLTHAESHVVDSCNAIIHECVETLLNEVESEWDHQVEQVHTEAQRQHKEIETRLSHANCELMRERDRSERLADELKTKTIVLSQMAKASQSMRDGMATEAERAAAADAKLQQTRQEMTQSQHRIKEMKEEMAMLQEQNERLQRAAVKEEIEERCSMMAWEKERVDMSKRIQDLEIDLRRQTNVASNQVDDLQLQLAVSRAVLDQQVNKYRSQLKNSVASTRLAKELYSDNCRLLSDSNSLKSNRSRLESSTQQSQQKAVALHGLVKTLGPQILKLTTLTHDGKRLS